jgi:hypothetical protein
MDNQLFMGRQAFVDQNLNFANANFPGLQIKDQLNLIDGNLASVRYWFQGISGMTGKKLQVAGGKSFVYD